MADPTAPARVLVVEDELLVAADLQEALERLGYEVPVAVRSGELALQVLDTAAPDVVLLDINLRGTLDGVETAAAIRARRAVPIVFLTGLADRATLDRALAQHPAGYLVKPFVERDLGITLALALRNGAAPPASAEPEPAIEAVTGGEEGDAYSVADGVFIRHLGRHVKVPFADILFIEAQGNYCRFVTAGGEYLLTIVLKQLLDRLAQPALLRIHRSYVVNLAHVTGYDELRVLVAGKHELPLGQTYRAELLRRLTTL